MKRRGVTLIELMVTVVIASVVLTAAVGVLVGFSRHLRISERKTEAHNAAMLASAMLQADVTNAGYRFPSPAFSLRHYNNVDNATQLRSGAPDAPTYISVMGGCGGANVGLVPGTDVIEVTQGFESLGPGRVTAGGGTTVQLGLPGLPFENAEYPTTGIGSVLLFTGTDQRSCLARVTALDNTASFTVNFDLIDRDFQVVGATAYPASCPTPGPGGGTRAYRLQRVVRYMVCARAGAGANENALYRQVADEHGVFADPELIQEGVEDLQLAPAYWDPDGQIKATGTGVSCVGMGALAELCYCDDDPAPSCSIPAAQLEPALGTPALPLDTVADPAGVLVSRIRGGRLIVTGVSQRLVADPGTSAADMPAELRRPDAFDHTGMAAGAQDGYFRTQLQTSFHLHNAEVAP